MKTWKYALSALATAALLAGCGGGGGVATSSSAGITTIKVVGDSLADSGVFGFKWAMQGTAAEPMLIWTDRINSTYAAPALCPRYIATSASTAVANPAATACNSYAIGGGRINVPTGPTVPFSIVKQLTDLAAEKPYAAGDLLLVVGGGNDAADLVGAFLNVPKDSGASYSGLLGTVLPASVVVAQAAGGQAGLAAAGGMYMVALADKFYDVIKAQALDKGAKRVAVLNMPGITNTPRFQATLDLVALGSGGGATGAKTRAETEGLIKQWVVAFNTQLAKKFAGEPNVLVVDFYSNFNDQIANPAQYGLTNVKTPACPSTGISATDGLAEYSAATCTFASLSAQTPPAGATGGADWWKSYAFSDGFHPTATGYKLLAQLVTKELAAKGWL